MGRTAQAAASLPRSERTNDGRFTAYPEVDVVLGNSHLQGVVPVGFTGCRVPGLAALAENRDVVRCERHNYLIGVPHADAVEEAEPPIPFPHEKHRCIADQELLVACTENLEVEGTEADAETLEAVFKADAEQRAAAN